MQSVIDETIHPVVKKLTQINMDELQKQLHQNMFPMISEEGNQLWVVFLFFSFMIWIGLMAFVHIYTASFIKLFCSPDTLTKYKNLGR